jgi:hypothetical protein
MASSYTPAGIELIATGEQSGTWGATTNTNWELIEELATGLVSIALTGTTYSLSMTNGTASEGRHAIVKFTGSPGGACTVTVTPNDMQKIYWVVNSADQNVVISQGSGANVTVPAGQKKALYCDGAGSGAAVVDLFEDVAVKDLYLTGTLFLGGTQVNATASELNVLDGNTAATSTTLADADRVVVNDNGTMVQVALTDFETYFESALDTLSNVTAVGALDSGSITSNFGTINTGSSNITTSGTVSFGSLTDGTITVTAFVDDDSMSSDSDTLIPTQQSVKAYVDAQVQTVDTLSEILANGNTSGSTDLVISASQKITTDTIEETTSSSGVTVGSTLKVDTISEKTSANGVKIDGVRVKDNTVVIDAATGTNTAGTGVTIAGGPGTGTGAGGSIVFQTAAAGTTGSTANTLATAVTIDSTGGFTLGTSTTVSSILDEDAMGSDSATALATQQSIKKYVDDSVSDAVVDGDFTSAGFMKTDGSGTYSVDTNTYLTSETSHSDVVVDGDFTSAGFMKTDGSGNYSVDTNTYLTSETSHSDVVVDGDFASAGLMKTNGSGTYSVITDNSANWDTAYGWGDHSTQGYITSGSALSNVVEDTTPQLGGDLDCNGNDIFVDADNYIYLGDGQHGGGSPNYDGRIHSNSTTKRTAWTHPPKYLASTTEDQYDIYLEIGSTNIGTAAGDIRLNAGGTLGSGDTDITGGGVYLSAGDERVSSATTTEGAGLYVKQDLSLFAASADQSSVDIDGRAVLIYGGIATGGGTGGSIKFNTYDATGQTPGTSEFNVFETLGGEFKQTGEFYLYEGLNVTGTSTLDAVNVTGDVDITGEIKADSYNESYSVLGTTGSVTLDCEDGNTFLCDMTGNVTFTFSNPPASGTGYTMTIELIQDSTARTVTWPASVDWPGGTAPTISTTSGAVDVFVFTTRNGGTTWYGFTAGQAIA